MNTTDERPQAREDELLDAGCVRVRYLMVGRMLETPARPDRSSLGEEFSVSTVKFSC